ncbi:hypothetical protein [Agrococcus baldri]|uniref:OCRE domain-containing protein n=1 Tax=Agrococcus baldri TaxID=153730 RepID=A0AA87RJU6_9MICO|nr:hypothetical protein [Agrococcus baldri]GEK81475.1 hypothetical protein ABA31_28260 [Agrococcus baldri]
MTDIDRNLLEATKSHRTRLASAFVFGRQRERRAVQTNVGRVTGSIVLAAVVCIGCIGTSFVLDLLESNRNEAAITAFQEALASNPIQPTDEMPEDEATGFLVDPASDDLIDPQTGFRVDRETMLATDLEGRTIDPRLDWFFDPQTGYYTDPTSGITIDPTTLQVVEEQD